MSEIRILITSFSFLCPTYKRHLNQLWIFCVFCFFQWTREKTRKWFCEWGGIFQSEATWKTCHSGDFCLKWNLLKFPLSRERSHIPFKGSLAFRWNSYMGDVIVSFPGKDIDLRPGRIVNERVPREKALMICRPFRWYLPKKLTLQNLRLVG